MSTGFQEKGGYPARKRHASCRTEHASEGGELTSWIALERRPTGNLCGWLSVGGPALQSNSLSRKAQQDPHPWEKIHRNPRKAVLVKREPLAVDVEHDRRGRLLWSLWMNTGLLRRL